jgi:hypothetical protein
MGMTSAILFFLFSSTLLFLLTLRFRARWEAQWWKVTLLVLFLDLMMNSLLLHLLAGSPQTIDLATWCFVVLNGCNQIAHWLVWLLTTSLLLQEIIQLVKKYQQKSDERQPPN